MIDRKAVLQEEVAPALSPPCYMQLQDELGSSNLLGKFLEEASACQKLRWVGEYFQ